MQLPRRRTIRVLIRKQITNLAGLTAPARLVWIAKDLNSPIARVSNFAGFRGVVPLSAHEYRPALDAVGRFNWKYFDAAGVDGEAVVKGCQVEIAVDRAQVGKIRTAAR
jgi:hypothetical protein